MESVFVPPDRIAEILPLWLDAFPGDTAEDVGKFLEKVFPQSRCLAVRENGKPVSMVFLLPARLEWGGDRPGTMPLQYIYAAGTLSSRRGRGIFGRLLNEALEAARSEGIPASFLRPAEPSLFAYYERFGYRPFFYARTLRLSRGEFLRGSGRARGTPPEGGAGAVRGRLLEELPVRVRWPEFIVGYAEEYVREAGGETLAVDGGWALCEPRGDLLWIREWLCRSAAEPALRAAAGRRFSAGTILLRRPASPEDGGEPFGMICPLNGEAEKRLAGLKPGFPYMGLALD